jgi:hypothetical protein
MGKWQLDSESATNGSPFRAEACMVRLAVPSDAFIIIACTVAGTAVGGVRCLQAAGAGAFRSASVFRHLLRGVVVGLVIGLLVAELKELW